MRGVFVGHNSSSSQYLKYRNNFQLKVRQYISFRSTPQICKRTDIPLPCCTTCCIQFAGKKQQINTQKLKKQLNRTKVKASEDVQQSPVGSQQENVGDAKLIGLLVSVQLSFAVWYVLGGQVLGSADPLTFSLLREVGAAGILLQIARTVDGPVKLQKAEDLIHFSILGFLCFGCIAGFTAGLSLVSDFNAAVVQPLTPVASLIFSTLEGHEKFTWRSGAGVILSVLGSILVVLSQGGSTGTDAGLSGAALLGNSFLLFSVLSYGYLYVYMNRVKDRYPTFTMTSWYYVVCTILCFFSCLQLQGWNVGLLVGDITSFNFETWGVLLYAIIFATVYNFSASSYANQKMPTSIASAYQTLQPFFVAMIGTFFMGSQITMEEIGAAGIIVGGLYLCVTADTQMEQVPDNNSNIVQGMWQQIVDIISMRGEEREQEISEKWNQILVKLGIKEKELTWIEQKLTSIGWLEKEGESQQVSLMPGLEGDSE